MLRSPNDRTPKPRVVRLGSREVITEGLQLSFWTDISHRCMTASWPAFIAGAAFVFIIFNAAFALLYWIGDDPISNPERHCSSFRLGPAERAAASSLRRGFRG